MNIRSVLIALALILLGVFTLLNWSAFMAPTTLSLGFADVQAPLGLLMLIVTGIVAGLFLVYILFQQASVIMESRRTAKELKAHRELADKAEASRFTEMRTFLDGELRKLEAQNAAAQRETAARIDQLDSKLYAKMAETARVLSAYVGEVEDKIDRVLPHPPALPR